jgi:hypothetical protein
MNMDPVNRERDVDVDQWLESALSQHGKAEPRTGLENRVLANLKAERNRIASRRPWWWPLGAVAASVAIVAALWLGESSRKRNPGTVAETSTTTQREEVHEPAQPGPPSQIAHTARDVAQHRPAHWPIHDLAGKRTPKLDQFPSRRNMSEGESLLARLLKEQSNKEALLESTPIREEVDLSIDSLEIRPLEIPDIEISESKTN